MKNRIFSLVAIAAVVTLGACKKDGDNAGGSETTQADTTTQVTTTQDTQAVVTQTTTTVDTAKVDSTGKTPAAAPATTDTAHKM